jgi:hypothetical protein
VLLLICFDLKTDVLILKSKHQFYGHLFFAFVCITLRKPIILDHKTDVLILKSKHQNSGQKKGAKTTSAVVKEPQKSSRSSCSGCGD